MPSARPVGRFPAAYRVRRRAEFAAVHANARRVVSPHFVFLIHARPDPASPVDGARLGVVASRKIGNAVQRNRAKRLVREAFRSTRELFRPGTDVVVIVRSGLGKLKLDDVVAEWRAEAPRIERRSQEALARRGRPRGETKESRP